MAETLLIIITTLAVSGVIIGVIVLRRLVRLFGIAIDLLSENIKLNHQFTSRIEDLDADIRNLSVDQKNILKSVSIARASIVKNGHMIKNPSASLGLYRQIEAAKDIRDIIGGGCTRNLRGWAISPDALMVIFNYVQHYNPAVVLELGGGYSTIALASYIKANALSTKIISVDHDEHYYHQTNKQIDSAGLGSLVTTVHAPLKNYGQYSWYDEAAIKDGLGGLKPGLIIVDGPPESTNDNARLPLFDHVGGFAREYSILLDDAARSGEKNAVQHWLERDARLVHTYIYTEKGLSLLTTRKDVDAAQLY